jgi:exonuclease VII small subunit
MSRELERAIEYRARAEELLRQCERHTQERKRAVLLDLAATYHRMANQIEEAFRLDIEAKNKAKGG